MKCDLYQNNYIDNFPLHHTILVTTHHSHALITQCAHPRVRIRVVEAVLFADTLGAGRAQRSSVEYPAKPRATPRTVGAWPSCRMLYRLSSNIIPQRPVNYHKQKK